MNFKKFLISILTISTLVSCSSEEGKQKSLHEEQASNNTEYPLSNKDKRRADRGRMLGAGGSLFGNGGDESNSQVKGGVNAYLWQASLEVLSFMPLASADATGGVIITDWYEGAETKGERIKANVLINSKELRASGVTVSLFRQAYSGGRWINAKSNKETATKLEDKILTRARELRLSGDV